MIKLLLPLLLPPTLTPVAEIGILPTWALWLIAVGAAVISIWVLWLIKRKPKPEPEPTKAGGDIIARQGGQKRNRVHVYRQPFGHPIRLCDWIHVDRETIERIGETQGILGGPAEKEALVMGLDWAEANKGAVICKYCRATVKGKRGPIMGGPGGNNAL